MLRAALFVAKKTEMDKPTTLFLYSGILVSNKKKQIMDI